MRIEKEAIAGTLESSDVLVRVAPAEEREVTISSTVLAQYGDEIRALVDDVLDRLGVSAGSLIVEDKGALDCTIRARVEAAVARAADAPVDWSAL